MGPLKPEGGEGVGLGAGGVGPGLGPGDGDGPGDGPGGPAAQVQSDDGQLGGTWLQLALHHASVTEGEMARHAFADVRTVEPEDETLRRRRRRTPASSVVVVHMVLVRRTCMLWEREAMGGVREGMLPQRFPSQLLEPTSPYSPSTLSRSSAGMKPETLFTSSTFRRHHYAHA